jgi:uncharacterized protein YecT (DUF1311 family)
MLVNKTTLTAIIVVLMAAFTSNSIYAQSQLALNMKAGSDYEKADKELNVVYKKILKEYAAQPIFIKRLKAAQRLWIQLRDAELSVRYPERENYGSGAAMCESLYLETLTRERTKFLKVWLAGIAEGDVCSGSVKNK